MLSGFFIHVLGQGLNILGTMGITHGIKKIFLFLVVLAFLMPFGKGISNAQNNSDGNFLSIPDFAMHKINTGREYENFDISKLRAVPENEIIKSRKNVSQQEKPHKETSFPKEKPLPKPIEKRIVSDESSSPKISPKKSSLKNIAPASSAEEKMVKISFPEAAQVNSSAESIQSSNEASKINQINQKLDNLEKNGRSKIISTPNGGPDYTKAFASLSLVLPLIFIVAWIYSKVKGINPATILSGNFAQKELNKFNIVSSSTLGQGKDIHLVEINGKQLVIGSTANNINLLTEIPPEFFYSDKQENKIQPGFNTDIKELKEAMEFAKVSSSITEENEEKNPDEKKDKAAEGIDEEFVNPDYYSSQYSEVYKEYMKKDSE